MKTNYWFALPLVFALGTVDGFSAAAAHKKSAKPATAKAAAKAPAAPSAPSIDPGPAVVTQDHVNVRARADVDSEVVAHLKKNDLVTVVEETSTRKPSPGEPVRWAKITWPSEAPVWVYADFVDRGASAVKAPKLNLRSGPGENYSVVGTLEKGTALKKLDSKGDWWKIEAPEGCHAYVAANLLQSKPSVEPVKVAEKEPAPVSVPATTIAAPATRPPGAAPRPAVPSRPLPPMNTVDLAGQPASTPAAPRPQPFIPAAVPPPQPSVVLPVASAPAPVPQPAAPVAKPSVSTPPAILSREPADLDLKPAREEAYVKRIVTREGVVRRTLNVQSPSFYVLENLHNGRVMDYLYTSNTNLNLGSYRGRVVNVTGEEALDERWPNTPVIRVESLHTAP